MLNAGISSTRHIAAFWQLAEPVAAAAQDNLTTEAATAAAMRHQNSGLRPDGTKPAKSGPAKIIEDALRAAGLMR